MNTINSDLIFSVLIANYNNGKYLIEAIESVCKQTYTNWEIIIVDDGSTDNSIELYRELKKDERIHIYLNEENRGCGYTKNRCVQIARGDIAGFLDADDALTPNALDVMVNEHIQHPKASAVYSDFYRCNERLETLCVNQAAQEIPQTTDYLHYQRGCIGHFFTFKLKAIQCIGINEHYLIAEDQDLYYKLEEMGSMIFHNEPLYYYRFHEKSISLNDNVYKARIWHIIAIYEACVRRGIPQDAEKIGATLWDYAMADAIHKSLKKYEHPTFKTVLKTIYRWITRK